MNRLEHAHGYDFENREKRNLRSLLPEGQSVRLKTSVFVEIYPSSLFALLEIQLENWVSQFEHSRPKLENLTHFTKDSVLTPLGFHKLGWIFPASTEPLRVFASMLPGIRSDLPEHVSRISVWMTRILPSVIVVGMQVSWKVEASDPFKSVLTRIYPTKFVDIKQTNRSSSWSEMSPDQQRQQDIEQQFAKLSETGEAILSRYFAGALQSGFLDSPRVPAFHFIALKRMAELDFGHWVDSERNFLGNFSDHLAPWNLYAREHLLVFQSGTWAPTAKARSFIGLLPEASSEKDEESVGFLFEVSEDEELRSTVEVLAVRTYLDREAEKAVRAASETPDDCGLPEQTVHLVEEAKNQLTSMAQFAAFRTLLGRLCSEISDESRIKMWLQEALRAPEIRCIDSRYGSGLTQDIFAGVKHLAQRLQERLRLLVEIQTQSAAIRGLAIEFGLSSSNLKLQRSIYWLTWVMAAFALVQIVLYLFKE